MIQEGAVCRIDVGRSSWPCVVAALFGRDIVVMSLGAGAPSAHDLKVAPQGWLRYAVGRIQYAHRGVAMGTRRRGSNVFRVLDHWTPSGRRYTRVALALPVEVAGVRDGELHDCFEGLTSDISAGGVRVGELRDAREMEALRVTLTLEGHPPLVVAAVTAHQTAGSTGLEFRGLTDAQRLTLSDVVLDAVYDALGTNAPDHIAPPPERADAA